MNKSSISKAALIVFDDRGRLLMTRETGKSTFAFPGGKVDPDEAVEHALAREIAEELAATVSDVRVLGVASGQTNDGRNLTIHMFSGRLEGVPSRSGEIVELRWVTAQEILTNEDDVFTPITRGACFDILVAGGLR